MEKFKGYLFVFLGCVACFTYGAYLYGYLNYDVVVKPHQWILTGFFGLFFMALGINHFIEKAVENMKDKILDQRFEHTVNISYGTDLINEVDKTLEKLQTHGLVLSVQKSSGVDCVNYIIKFKNAEGSFLFGTSRPQIKL